MLQATARWEAFFCQIFRSESPCHYLGEISRFALYYYHLPSPAWNLKAFQRPNCSFCIMSLGLIFGSLSTWRFLADKAQLILTPVTSIMCLQGPPRPPCSAVRSTRRLPSQQRRLVATEQQPRSSLRAYSELTAKKLWWLFSMSKAFSLTEINLELNPEYFKTNKFNHDFICKFIFRNSAIISRYSS